MTGNVACEWWYGHALGGLRRDNLFFIGNYYLTMISPRYKTKNQRPAGTLP